MSFKEEVKDYWPIIYSLGGFVIAEVISNIKMKWSHEALKRQITGIANNLRDFQSATDKSLKKANGRLHNIEGFLGGAYNKKFERPADADS